MKITNANSLWALALLPTLLGGCTSTLDVYEFYGDPGIENVEFSGLNAYFQHTNPKISGVNVLMIHGMGGYANSDHSTVPVDLVEDRLGLRRKSDPYFKRIRDSNGSIIGSLETTLYNSSSTDRKIAFNVMYWSQSTWNLKWQLALRDNSDEWMTRNRLKNMNRVKQDLLNWNVSDVLLYLGQKNQSIDAAVSGALQQMVDDPKQDFSNRPLLIISFSQGSFIVAHVLEKMRRYGPTKQRSTARTVQSQVCKIFMLSNQIPLLDLALPIKPSKSQGSDLESLTVNARPDFGATASEQVSVPLTAMSDTPLFNTKNNNLCFDEPKIVAISDPNDVLSYSFSDYFKEEDPKTYIDVLISIAKTEYRIPLTTPGNGIVNPIDAHTGYGTNSKVLDLIVDGASVKRGAQPKSR